MTKKIDIYAKAAFDENQIQTKARIGADGIELQLLPSFEDNSFKTIDVIPLINKINIPITVIHTPLPDNGYEIQDIFPRNKVFVLDKICHLASDIAEYQNNKIIIVLHLTCSMKFLLQSTELLKNITDYFYKAQKMYPLISFGIENMSPVKAGKGKIQKICEGGFLFDTVLLVDYLKSKGIYNCGTVLDICHAKNTINFFNIMEKMGLESPIKSISEFFDENKNTINLIHLSDSEDLGFRRNTHGMPFGEHNIEYLKEIMNLYTKYNYKCPITIEVFEEDYLISENYKKTKSLLLEII